MQRLYLQSGNDDHLYAGLYVAVDLDGNLVGTEGFDGLFEPDAAPVEVDAAGLLDSVGDIGCGDRAEEPLVLAGAGLDGDDALVEGLGYLGGLVGKTPVSFLGLLHPAACLFELGRGCHLGETPGQEEVADVATAHVHDVAPLPDLLDVLGKYDLHEVPTSLPPRASAPFRWRALSRSRPRAGAAGRDP